MIKKAFQFGAGGLAAFAFVGFLLPWVVPGERTPPHVVQSRNTKALGPGAPWRLEEDRNLAKRLHDAEPALTPIALWRCARPVCGFEGRFMVFAGPDAEVPRPRLEALLDLAALPIRAEHEWPAYPDTQAQGFRYSDRVYYVVSQSDGAAAMVAGNVIDQIAARLASAAPPPAAQDAARSKANETRTDETRTDETKTDKART